MRKKKLIATIAIITLLIVTCYAFRSDLLAIIYPDKYSEIVEKYSKECGIDNKLVLAIIKSESNFNPNVKSHKGAIGLMQLMEDTASEIASKNGINIDNKDMEQSLLNPNININIGTKYLQILIEKYNNIEVALTAYNAGTGNVDKWIEQGIIKEDGTNIENIPFKETNKYVRSILRDYKIYEKLYEEV